MSDTLSATFLHALPRSSIADISRQLGESEQAVSRGFELSSAAVLSGLTQKAGDATAMRQAVDLASTEPGDSITSALSGGQLRSSGSSLVMGIRPFLSNLFGGRHDAIVSSISRDSGLRVGAVSSVLALAAHSVLSSIGTRVRSGGMTASSLSSFLQNEAAGFRSSLPKGFDDVLSGPATGTRVVEPVMAQVIETNPVVAQTVKKDGSMLPWLLLPLAALLLGLFWFFARPRPRVAEVPVPTVPAVQTPAPAPAPVASVPAVPTLNFAENSAEARLLAFVRDPRTSIDNSSAFNFDRLLFDTGSATLRPESHEQLVDIASILKAYPNVHLKISGHTDSVGTPDQNMALSQARANNVMNELVSLGVSSDRLTAQGYGEEDAVADNATDSGRAQNRNISIQVTQK